MIRIAMLAAAFAFSASLGGCGSDDPPSESTIPATASTTEPGPEPEPSEDEVDAPLPPEEKTGSITYAGATATFGGDDLTAANGAICETVNPAFAGELNIQTRLSDGTDFSLMGNIDDYASSADPVVTLGDIGAEIPVEGLALALDGRTLTGTGTVSGDAIEFTFTC